uniref:Uncharacterized protein n=1 Tax=Mustela putorius furo TaxID=9669 RepID=M3Z8L9_MUSPF
MPTMHFSTCPTRLQGLTREGADGVLPAEVEALHEAVLGATEQHVGLGGVEADFVHRAFVLCEQLVLLVAGWPSQVPGDHHAIGGRRGQQVLIHLVPDHIRAAQVEGGLAAHTEVQLLHKLLVLNGVDLEDAAAGHNHLGCVPAHADGIGRRVQVAVHGTASQRAATQGCGHSGHLLHVCAGWGNRRLVTRAGLISPVGPVSSDPSPWLGPPRWLCPGRVSLGEPVQNSGLPLNEETSLSRSSAVPSAFRGAPTWSLPARASAPCPQQSDRAISGLSVRQSPQGSEGVPVVHTVRPGASGEGQRGAGDAHGRQGLSRSGSLRALAGGRRRARGSGGSGTAARGLGEASPSATTTTLS